MQWVGIYLPFTSIIIWDVFTPWSESTSDKLNRPDMSLEDACLSRAHTEQVSEVRGSGFRAKTGSYVQMDRQTLLEGHVSVWHWTNLGFKADWPDGCLTSLKKKVSKPPQDSQEIIWSDNLAHSQNSTRLAQGHLWECPTVAQHLDATFNFSEKRTSLCRLPPEGVQHWWCHT